MARAAELGRAVRRAVVAQPGRGLRHRDASTAASSKARPSRPASATPRSSRSTRARRRSRARRDRLGHARTVRPHGRTGPVRRRVDRRGRGACRGRARRTPTRTWPGRASPSCATRASTSRSASTRRKSRTTSRAYLTHRRLGRPFVTLKLAMTVDGRTITDDPATSGSPDPRRAPTAIACAPSTTRSSSARQHGARRQPAATTRDADGPDPVRVVLGARRPTPRCIPASKLPATSCESCADLAADGITVAARRRRRARRPARSTTRGLVDEYVLYVADAEPTTPPPMLRPHVGRSKSSTSAQIGNDVRVTLVPKRAAVAMFTGIVEELGTVRARDGGQVRVHRQDRGRRRRARRLDRLQRRVPHRHRLRRRLVRRRRRRRDAGPQHVRRLARRDPVNLERPGPRAGPSRRSHRAGPRRRRRHVCARARPICRSPATRRCSSTWSKRARSPSTASA